MAIRVHLNDGYTIVSRSSLKEMQQAYSKALDRHTVLDLKSSDGTVRAINPMQILYFEEIDDATADRLLNGQTRHLSVQA